MSKADTRDRSQGASVSFGRTQPKSPKREERNRRLGIDCADKLVWKHWTPGGEYVKALEIRNTLHQSQVIKYALPENKSTYFLEFPQPVTLAPGMCYPLEIKFRPSVSQDYTDRVEIFTKRGSFSVALESLLPYLDCRIDSALDFGFCPVKEVAERTITVTNTGTKQFQFKWTSEVPFNIEPHVGKLEPGQSATSKVTFEPREASFFVATAICQMRDPAAPNDCISSKLKLSGIGKYPFIRTKASDLDFGTVITGKEAHQTLVLENKSLVTARFSVQKTDADLENCFTFHPTKAEINPETSFQIRVTYKPTTSGTFSCDSYKIGTAGGNVISLRCQGQAVGPEVTLGVRSLNFGDTPENEVVVKHFNITNHSWVPAQFQWVGLHPGCGFEFVTPCGEVPGRDKVHKGSLTCTVRFNPQEAMNYYRRCYCLINNQNTLLYVDLLGSAFNEKEKKRPAPFTQRHVDIHRARLEAGLGKSTPEEIEIALASAGEGGAGGGDDEDEPLDADARDLLVTTMNASATAGAPPPAQLWRELFTPASDALALPFSLESDELDFGASLRMRGGDASPIYVRNNTAAKAAAVWRVPLDGAVWAVDPPSADIRPFSSQAFKVVFKPGTPNRFYYTTLECYVFYKTMRSFRLVNEVSFVPPTCLPLHVHGHTFPPMGFFTPDGHLNKHAITFPACHPSEQNHQILMLSNTGGQPMHWHITIDSTVSQHDEELKKTRAVREQMSAILDDGSGIMDSMGGTLQAAESRIIFTCFPSSGVVPPGGQQLIAFRFQPQMATTYRARARCRLNRMDSAVLDVALMGQSFNPRLLLADEGSIFFKPSHVGSTATRNYMIENPSRIALTFDWQIAQRHGGVVAIEPEMGILRGNERLQVKVTFRPNQEKKYMIKVPCNCTVVGMDDEPTAKYRTSLTVVGEGVLGGLTMEPAVLDFSTVRIGASESRQVMLFNSASCAVPFTLGYTLAPNAEADDSGSLLEFSTKEGVLPARTHIAVNVRFSPVQRMPYRLVAYCAHGPGAVAGRGASPRSEGSPVSDRGGTTRTGASGVEPDLSALPCCEITGAGAYPCLCISDVRALRVSKAHLWEQFSVNAINAAIAEERTDVDRKTTEFSIQRLIADSPAFRMDFTAGPVGSYPMVVYLQLANNGAMPAHFSFRFPHDTDLQVEQWWPDSVETDEEKVMEMIQDHRLFTIEPASGDVPAGGSVTVRFGYQHKFAGEHVLPVLFDVKDAKRLSLVLCGKTLRPDERHLHFVTDRHRFQPVAIGDADPPLQYYELRNLSLEPVQYSLDPAPFERIREANYQFPIFQCQNPEGVIAGQDSVWLRWLFTPLEPQVYELDCPILVEHQGEKTPCRVIKFSAEGYHSKKIAPEELEAMQANEFEDVNDRPEMAVSAMPVSLSMDVARLGRVACHSLHRRFLVLRNDSPTDTYSYIWNTTLPYGPAEIKVEPAKGSLAPGEHQVCKLVFDSGSLVQIIDMNVDCIVLNTTLRGAREEERRRAVEADHLLQHPMNDTFCEHMDPKTASQSSRAKAQYDRQGMFVSQRKYRRPVNERQDQTYANAMTTIVQRQDIVAEEVSPTQVDFYTSVLSDLLREVVHDPEVTEAYDSLHMDRVPYYYEVANTPRAVTRQPSAMLDTSRPPSATASTYLNASTVSVEPGGIATLPGAAESSVAERPAAEVSDPDLVEPEAPRLEPGEYFQRVMKAREAEQEAIEKRRALQSGGFQTVVEEVLESLSFDILSDAAYNKCSLMSASTADKLRMRRSMGGALKASAHTAP